MSNGIIFYLLWLAVFLSPFYTLRIGQVFLTWSDLLFMLSGIIMLLRAFLGQFKLSIRLRKSESVLLVGWLCGALLIISGYLVSELGNSMSGIDCLTNGLQYAFAMVYIPCLFCFLSYDARSRLSIAFVAGLMTVIAVGLLFRIVSKGAYANMANAGYFIGTTRFGSFMGSNGLAKTVAVCIPLISILRNNRLISFAGLCCCYILMTCGVFLAASWAGTGAALFAVILTLMVSAMERGKYEEVVKRILLMPISLVIICLLIGVGTRVGLLDTFVLRIVSVIRNWDMEGAGSLVVKLNLAKEAMNLLSNNPWIGIGSGVASSVTTYNQTIHNSYLLLWLEGGIISFLGLLISIVATLCSSVGVLKYESTASNARLWIVQIVVFVINCMTNTALYPRFIFMPLVLTGMVASNTAAHDNEQIGGHN